MILKIKFLIFNSDFAIARGSSWENVPKWFAWFKSGDFDLEDEEHPPAGKKNSRWGTEGITRWRLLPNKRREHLGVTQTAIAKCLKAAGYVQRIQELQYAKKLGAI